MNAVFPRDFLWGASTSAFQCEGGYGEGGKGIATTDALSPGHADARTASDHYHHWKEDVALMREMGLKAYRMSFSWSRIMPDTSGIPNKEGLAFYDRLIDALLEKGIEPLVTLYHFECPQALVDAFGGWKSRQMIDAYTNYAQICFRHFKGRVRTWTTVNEELVASAAANLTGDTETDPEKRLKNMYTIRYHISLAEHKAFQLLHKIDPDAKIGPVCSIQVVYPLTSDPKDVIAADNAEEMMEFSLLDMSVFGKVSPFVNNWLKEHHFLPEKRGGDDEILTGSKPDYIGINYYFSVCAKASDGILHFDLPPFWVSDSYEITANPKLEKTEWMNMGIDPEGLYTGMKKIFNRYHLPMIVTENGIAASEEIGTDGKIHDGYRVEYLSQHIQQVEKLLKEGYPVFGYCPWSFMDVVSSHQGFSKRYGFVYIDRTETETKDFKRIKKDSFDWYRRVIENNGI